MPNAFQVISFEGFAVYNCSCLVSFLFNISREDTLSLSCVLNSTQLSVKHLILFMRHQFIIYQNHIYSLLFWLLDYFRLCLDIRLSRVKTELWYFLCSNVICWRKIFDNFKCIAHGILNTIRECNKGIQ